MSDDNGEDQALPEPEGSPPGVYHDHLDRTCPACGSSRIDWGATGLNQCLDCDKLFRQNDQSSLRPLPEDFTAGATLPIEYLRETGLLWLINRAVLHPRGFALALHYDGQGRDRRVVGFTLEGDGREPWAMDRATIDEDALFNAVEAFLDLHR